MRCHGFGQFHFGNGGSGDEPNPQVMPLTAAIVRQQAEVCPCRQARFDTEACHQ